MNRFIDRMIAIDKLKHVIVAAYIILMSVQIIGLEGETVSLVKVAAMMMAPFLIVLMKLKINDYRPILLTGLYLSMMVICCLVSGQGISWPRIGYRAMFVMMFLCVYYIVYNGDINLQFVSKLLKILLIAYCVTYAVQHVLYLCGITETHLFNYYFQPNKYGIFKANGLSLEASHSGRIMPILYWGILKLSEIESGRPIGIIQSWKQFPVISALFWLTITTIGSAMAVIGGILILVYLFRCNKVLMLCGIALFVVLMNIEIDNSQFRRVQVVVNSVLTEAPKDTLIEKELSGATRIVPMMNMLSIDLSDRATWIGSGNDEKIGLNEIYDSTFLKSQYLGDIPNYGLITYIVSLIFVFGCCIRKFFSMETLFFFVFAMFSVGSVYYTWFMLMLFAMVWYYSDVCETRRAAASGDLAKT